MSTVRGESDDKIVVDAGELGGRGAGRPSGAPGRAEDPSAVRAKGTRQQAPLARPSGVHDTADRSDALAMLDLGDRRDPQPARARGTRQLERDPVEVLRMWPHTAASDPSAAPRATLRAASAGDHLDDKIKLAHLALDLYRELEELQAAAGGGPAVAHAVDCADPRCAARANALRGALVEACLLVQRIALLAPSMATTNEVDDRVGDLLALIDR